MNLDAHQHFWNYNAHEYPWIPAGSPLHRDWLPHDLAPLLAKSGIDGCVAVQARQNLDESRWLLDLAAKSSIIKAVVGWVDLRSDALRAQLDEFCSHHQFRGVRHVVQDEPDPEFMLGDAFLRGIGRLAEYRLAYDILIYPRQLPAAISLARRFHSQRLVLDHLAKPPIKSGALEPWQSFIRDLAREPNVWCKISGLVTEASHQSWAAPDFRPYLDTAFESFGARRLMYGSDWPVCLLAAEYEAVFSLAAEYAAFLDESDRAAFFGGNAAAFYGIAPPEG
jgi:L-fuconolactonase